MPTETQDGPLTHLLVEQQVDRILRSPGFSGSEVLRNMLAFLARHTLDRPTEPIKEYELGVTVLGKPQGFDPRLDSAVRVHAARLRAKLAEYYMADGSADPILIEIPKGSYHLSWRSRSIAEPPSSLAPPSPRPWKAFGIGFGLAAVLALAIIGLWPSASSPRMPAPVEAFWRPFLRSPEPPIIVFSNHRFVGTSATGLRSFREGVDSPADSNDTYSGTGTVMAVAQLTNLFSIASATPRLKRAELLTWDEAKRTNVVFVGGPDANSRLRELAPLQHFRFKPFYDEPRPGTAGIINVKPAPGEDSVYFGSGRPYTSDHAVIAKLPNLDPTRKVLILAGTNTYGVQGAAEFLTRPDLLTTLARSLGTAPNQPLPDFEAIVKVDVSGGVPVRSTLVTLRRR